MRFPPFCILLFICCSIVLLSSGCGRIQEDSCFMPVIDSEWWRVGNNPDLGALMPEEDAKRRPQVVDHGFIKAANGT